MTPDELDTAIREELRTEARRAPAAAPVKAQVLLATRSLTTDDGQPGGLRAWLVPMLAAAAVLLVTLGVTAGSKLLRSDGPNRAKPTGTAAATPSDSARPTPSSTTPQHWWYQHVDADALPHTPGLCPTGLTVGPLAPQVPSHQDRPQLPVAQAISVPGEPEPLWLLPVTCNGPTDGSHPIPIEVFRYRPDGPQLVQTLAYQPGDPRSILVSSIAVTATSDLVLTEQGYAPTDPIGGRSLRFSQDYTWRPGPDARYVAGPQVDTLQVCADNHLTVTSEPLTGQNGYENSRGILLTYLDDGTEPCTLTGYPGAAIVNAAGSTVADAVPTPAGVLGGYTSGGFAPRVVLYVRSGSAVIEWTVTPRGGSKCYSDVTVVSTPPGTTATKSYGRQARVCGLQVHPVVLR
ncbi:MAG: hypothetical protein QOE53_596 [Pseudonocardiales bacterium]|jgi:hypothetical protein|nr:hypothetical protein [Pseudonocardiales bacterium]